MTDRRPRKVGEVGTKDRRFGWGHATPFRLAVATTCSWTLGVLTVSFVAWAFVVKGHTEPIVWLIGVLGLGTAYSGYLLNVIGPTSLDDAVTRADAIHMAAIAPAAMDLRMRACSLVEHLDAAERDDFEMELNASIKAFDNLVRGLEVTACSYL